MTRSGRIARFVATSWIRVATRLMTLAIAARGLVVLGTGWRCADLPRPHDDGTFANVESGIIPFPPIMTGLCSR
jgi:hypothetical protein